MVRSLAGAVAATVADAALGGRAFACWTYESPIDGGVGCFYRRRDAANARMIELTKQENDEPAAEPEPQQDPVESEPDPVQSDPEPAQARAAVAPDQPYRGQHIGCHVLAGNLGNTRFYRFHAHRFRAEMSGYVRSVRWLNVYSFSRPGYHDGNGGRLSVSIQTDNYGRPSGYKLGTTSVTGPGISIGQQPQLFFEQPIYLEEGQVYHIVYRQHAGSEGFVSVDDLDISRPPEALSSYPHWSDDLASLMFRGGSDEANGSWEKRPWRIPVFELLYANNVIKGQGWVNGGRNHTANVEGSRRASQLLRMTIGSAPLQQLSFACFRKSGGGGDLNVRLEQSNGTEVASFKVARNSIKQTQGDFGNQPPIEWVRLNVPGKPMLYQGQNYRVVFSAPGGSDYWFMPAQRGDVFSSFTEDKLKTVMSAKYSTNGGNSWTDWPVSWSFGFDRSWSLPVFLTFS